MGAPRYGLRLAGVAVVGLTLAAAACQALSHSDDFATHVDASTPPEIVFVEGGTTTVIIDGGTIIIDGGTIVLDSGVECPTGELLCTSEAGVARCADPTAEALNCGGCNLACPQTQVCDGGGCGCAGGTTSCNVAAVDGGDAGAACVDMSSDPSNCGSCGNACGNEHICSAGKCIATCPPSSTNCSEDCVDITSDGTNCGKCGNSCSGGGCESQETDAGDVAYICCGSHCTCDAPKTQCGAKCVDTMTNADFCGGCDAGACGSGQGCDGGTCFCSDVTRTLCGKSCVTCPIGGTCVGDQCPCPDGTGVSNGVCCPSGQVGSGGTCCPSGQVASGGICCPEGEVNLNNSGVCCDSKGTVDAGSCCTTNGAACCPNGQVACSVATTVTPIAMDKGSGTPIQFAHTCTTPDACKASGGMVIP